MTIVLGFDVSDSFQWFQEFLISSSQIQNERLQKNVLSIVECDLIFSVLNKHKII